jgi:hypothetical protein
MPLKPEDARDLELAVRHLEYTSIAMRIANAIGKPIEYGIRQLPDGGRAMIQKVARTAIEKCLDMAVKTLGRQPTPASGAFHKWATGVSGAVGGFFGLPALALELPVSTTMMLRAIAEIAREEGEDLADPNARLECLSVFAFGGPSSEENAAETGYYAVRAAMARAIQEAAAYLSERGLAEGGAPAVVRFATQVASRFGITISEKAAAQAVPVIGAVAGGAINVAFTDHFQDVASGHFTVRRLERTYGQEAVHAEYERIKAKLAA